MTKPALIERARPPRSVTLPSSMLAANDQLKKRLRAMEEDGVRKLSGFYKTAHTDMVNGLEDYSPTRAWLAVYMGRVRRALEQLGASAAQDGVRRAAYAYQLSYYSSLYQIDRMTKPGAPLDTRPPSPLSSQREQVEAVYDQLIRSLLGQGWIDEYADTLDLIVPQIRMAVSQGMSAGEGIDQIAMRLRSIMGLPTDARRLPVTVRGGYRASFNKLQMITRTVVNTASNTGAVEAYRRNADILSGYQWMAAKVGACPDCQALNGSTYRLSDYIRPPKHPNCRCTVVPVISPDWRATPEEVQSGPSFGSWLLGLGAGLSVSSLTL